MTVALGQNGNDRFLAGTDPGRDNFNGNAGRGLRSTYEGLDERVVVTLAGGGFNDGPVDDRDALLSVESARGGSAGDELTGSSDRKHARR